MNVIWCFKVYFVDFKKGKDKVFVSIFFFYISIVVMLFKYVKICSFMKNKMNLCLLCEYYFLILKYFIYFDKYIEFIYK